MSNIKQLCKKQLKGQHTFDFTAESSRATLLCEETANLTTSISLSLISNGNKVHWGTLFNNMGENQVQRMNFLKGEKYEISVSGESRRVKQDDPKSPLEPAKIKIGIFWE